MTEDPRFNRKDFISVSTRLFLWLAGLLGLGGLIRFFSHSSEHNTSQILDLGPIRDLAPDEMIIFQDIPAVLFRTASGFTAFSLRCTHLGCTLENGTDRFVCPCHGSEYSLGGKILKGPALDDLTELNVFESEDGHLMIKTREATQ
jgi:Rieske Fe-S protein